MSDPKSHIVKAISIVISGNNLSQEQSRDVMEEIMDGLATPAQIGSLITALRMKGETAEEITGFAETMRNKSNHVITEHNNLLDTCGTGGSGVHKFNISTSSAIIAAACGVRVAKHGNRAMSGETGSADVLEALGVNIGLSSEQASQCLEKIGICFMFAQLYHPSMKHAAGPRKELGIRTVFNMLGPLTNPAGADRQMIGVFERSRTAVLANVLRHLGLKRAMVVSSLDGLDEISISAATQVSELRSGNVHTYEVSPQDFGLKTYMLQDISGGNAAANADIIHRVLRGEPGAYRDIVLANAGACIYLADRCDTLTEGAYIAAEAIDSGKAYEKLQQLIKITGDLSYVS